MTRIKQLGPRALPVLLVGVFLIGVSPAMTEECSPPCTTTRSGLPTFRLINTANGDFWDLESSAFGLELVDVGNDTPANGAFRIEDGADANTLVIDNSGKVGIGTTSPVTELQISDATPEIRLDDTSSGAGKVDFRMNGDTLFVEGNPGNAILQIDTRSIALAIATNELGRVGIGTEFPQALLHVFGPARIESGLDVFGSARFEGDFAIASSRTLKTGFESVSSTEILAAVADLPLASWRYKSENESTRHIGPFAEDFQRLFGLGDGETISVIDAQGVAFAAIQGLYRQLAAKEAELASLREEKNAGIASLGRLLAAQNAELSARLAAVEERLRAQ